MRTRRAAALATTILGLTGCVDNAFQVGDDGFELPATLEEVLPMAESVAREWDQDAYLWGMGAEFTITDRNGRAFDHSYRFYSGRSRQRLDLHFFGGAAWGDENFKFPPPTPISQNPPAITSAQACSIVVGIAESLLVPVPEDLTVSYLGFPVWPEGVPNDEQVVAWRVDFLELRLTGPPGQQDVDWWSVFRAYLNPADGSTLEVIRREERYPTPPPG
jgi:hypothetical protein